ncbi:MAG: hypothetical protein J5706_05060 [Elusimicrobiales bacterium]|nr:hypothetical protein [Elusimicrobiales bacterium]
MQIVLSVCAVLITLAIIALIVQLIITLRQFTNTGKAIEYLALNADSKLEALDPVVTSVKSVSGMVNSVWFKGAAAFYAIVSKFKSFSQIGKK